MYRMCIMIVYTIALAVSQSAIAQEVRFSDDNLRIAVSAALGVKYPTASDMKKLTSLVRDLPSRIHREGNLLLK